MYYLFLIHQILIHLMNVEKLYVYCFIINWLYVSSAKTK